MQREVGMIDRERLRMRRLKLRFSQKELGKAVGQDQSYISKLERGELTEITVTTLVRLAQKLGVSLDYLVNPTQEPDDTVATPLVRPWLLTRPTPAAL
jgi:transcriptional regulator with XRE-family HTH domain